jgi:hypothetical protein
VIWLGTLRQSGEGGYRAVIARKVAFQSSFALAGMLAGVLLLPMLVFADCPRSYREVDVPQDKNQSEAVLLFVDPQCPLCVKMKAEVLPAFSGSVKWFELSRCNPQGLSLMKDFKITEFPTLLLVRNHTVAQRATGIDEIRSALQAMRPGRP